MEKSKEKIHRVKFLDKKDRMWYSLTEEPVTREEAEEIYKKMFGNDVIEVWKLLKRK